MQLLLISEFWLLQCPLLPWTVQVAYAIRDVYVHTFAPEGAPSALPEDPKISDAK